MHDDESSALATYPADESVEILSSKQKVDSLLPSKPRFSLCALGTMSLVPSLVDRFEPKPALAITRAARDHKVNTKTNRDEVHSRQERTAFLVAGLRTSRIGSRRNRSLLSRSMLSARNRMCERTVLPLQRSPPPIPGVDEYMDSIL